MAEVNALHTSEEESEDEDYVPKRLTGDSDGETISKRRRRKLPKRSSRNQDVKDESDDEEKKEMRKSTPSNDSDWNAFLTRYSGRTSEKRGETPDHTSSATKTTSTTSSSSCTDETRPSFTTSTAAVTSKSGDAPVGSEGGLKFASLPSAPASLQSFLNRRLGSSAAPAVVSESSNRTLVSSSSSHPDVKGSNALETLVAKITDGKPKETVLDKSQTDWEKFKRETGIVEEVEKKGRGIYTDKQAFLERVDWRTFEKEREVREAERKRRYARENASQ